MMTHDRENACNDAQSIAERSRSADDHADRGCIDVRTLRKVKDRSFFDTNQSHERRFEFGDRREAQLAENVNDVGVGELLVHERDGTFGIFSCGLGFSGLFQVGTAFTRIATRTLFIVRRGERGVQDGIIRRDSR